MRVVANFRRQCDDFISTLELGRRVHTMCTASLAINRFRPYAQ